MSVIVEPVAEMLAADTSLEGLGIQVLSAGGGTAVARMVVGPAAVNGHARAHGGLVYTLADTAFACAVNSSIPGSVTVSASIDYLSGAVLGEELLAEATVRTTRARSAVVDVTVRSGARVVAEYRGRSAQLRGVAPSSAAERIEEDRWRS